MKKTLLIILFSLIILAMPNYAAVYDNLIVNISFFEQIGSIIEDTQNSFNITVTGGASSAGIFNTSCVLGSCLWVAPTGLARTIDTGANWELVSNHQNKTICMWVRSNESSPAVSNTYFLSALGNGGGFAFRIFDISATNTYRAYLFTDTVLGTSIDIVGEDTTGVNLTDNFWHHICVSTSFNSTVVGEVVDVGLNLYADGVLVNYSSATDTDLGNPITYTLGGGSGFERDGLASEHHFYVDEFMIWNRTLSDSEISTLFNDTNTSPEFMLTHDTTIYENKNTIYTLNVTSVLSPTNITTQFLFNNTEYALTDHYNTGNIWVFETNFTIPFFTQPSSFESQSVSSFWNLTTQYNFANITEQISINQTLFSNKIISLCNNTAPHPVLNITYYDELTNANINVTNNYDVTFYDGTNTQTLSGTFEAERQSAFCTNINTTYPYNWNSWGTFELSQAGYATRIITYPQSDPLGISNSPPTLLSQYLIALADSTTIAYTWMTTTYLPVTGTLKIYRCEENNTQLLVESVPIAAGTAYSNIELTNTPYKYEVIIGDTTYSQAGWGICHIEYSATPTYYIDVAETTLQGSTGLLFIPCELSLVGSNQVQLLWEANPQDTTQLQGCISGYVTSLYGSQQTFQACSNTTSYSLITTISNTSDYLTASLTQSGVTVYCDSLLLNATSTTGIPQSSLGINGLFALIFALLGVALYLAGDGMIQTIAMILCLGIACFIGLAAFSWYVASSAAMFLIIITLISRHSRVKT